ncbi:MAG: cell division protein ZapA [Flavobacteriales bacterium]|nr:cell division protein ZapA [Flavobacteriales bacterium]|tara:strand:+ start:3425 stop:3712 length:288 start_codon:yes stop_codon:yes gene_type:complete
MSKLNIKLSISDRLYPMKVDASDEEVMRKSSQKINTIIKDFSEKYAVKDNQDLLAMCALSLSVQLEKKIKKNFDNEESLMQELTLIDDSLSNALK